MGKGSEGSISCVACLQVLGCIAFNLLGGSEEVGSIKKRNVEHRLYRYSTLQCCFVVKAFFTTWRRKTCGEERDILLFKFSSE